MKPVGATTHPTGLRIIQDFFLNIQCKSTQAFFIIGLDQRYDSPIKIKITKS